MIKSNTRATVRNKIRIFSILSYIGCDNSRGYREGSGLSGPCRRKFIFDISKSLLTPRYTILDSMFPPCNAISQGRPLLSNTSSEAGALPASRMTRNEYFLSQHFFIVFWKPLFSTFHCEPRTFFRFFEV